MDLPYLIIILLKYFLIFIFFQAVLFFFTAFIGAKKPTTKHFFISFIVIISLTTVYLSSEISREKSLKIRKGILVQVPDNLKHLYADDGKISNGEYYFHYFIIDFKKVFIKSTTDEVREKLKNNSREN